MMTPLGRAALLLLLLLPVTVACGGAGRSTGVAGKGAVVPADRATAAEDPAPVTPDALEPSEGFDVAAVTLTDGDGRVEVAVWVADTPQLRQRGLMERASLPAGAGMLFVFEGTTSGGFWMKDTLIPLSIAFVDDDGKVVETLDMEPCEADPCPVYTPDTPYRYALEVNQGFFEDRGITADWTLEMDDALGAS